MNLKSRIAIRIRELREQKKLTQQELAWNSDINRTFMNDVENGRRNISIETLDRIINGLEISTAEFFNNAIFYELKKKKR